MDDRLSQAYKLPSPRTTSTSFVYQPPVDKPDAFWVLCCESWGVLRIFFALRVFIVKEAQHQPSA